MKINKKNNQKEDNNYTSILNETPNPIGYLGYDNDEYPIMPVQPIIFVSKNKDIKLSEDLYSAPINAIGTFSFDICKNHFDEYVNDLGDVSKILDNNQIPIIIDSFTEYIIRNTFNNFCIMIDNVGPQFKSVIKYVPLKANVHEYLFDEKSKCYTNIKNILFNFYISYTKNHAYLFNNAFEVSDEEKNIVDKYISIIKFQICEQIFSSLCYASEEAISNIYYNVFNSPNIKYIYDNAMEVLGIKEFNSSTPMYLAGTIKRLLLSNINIMMSSAIAPSIEELFEKIRMNMYFVFSSMSIEYNKIINNKLTDNIIDN